MRIPSKNVGRLTAGACALLLVLAGCSSSSSTQGGSSVAGTSTSPTGSSNSVGSTSSAVTAGSGAQSPSSGAGGASGSSSSSQSAIGAPVSIDTLTPGTLRVGTTTDSKPYEYVDGTTLKGFDIDLVNAVAAKLNVKVNFVTQDFSALLASVNNKQFDMAAASIGITKKRQALVDFTDGYLVGYLGVLAFPNSGISDVKSVAGKRVAVLQGSIEDTYASTYIPDAQIVRFPDANSAFLALQNKTVVAYFNDYVVVQSFQEKYPNLKLVIPFKIPTLNLPAGWAVHKGNTQLITALNGALKQVVDDGTWTKLYKKWFPTVPMTPLPPYKVSSGGPN